MYFKKPYQSEIHPKVYLKVEKYKHKPIFSQTKELVIETTQQYNQA